ncbi:MAG: Oligosaccharyl transferase STT3 subunit [Methanobacterium sp. PtaB.Bin024]|nr:MAG: Oligosaccharyl transferase STT3 subunit [Methanobacterium sp. PtaB.Bin024]
MNKEFLIQVGIVLLIFSVGVFLRLDTINIAGDFDFKNPYYQDENGLPYMTELDSYYNYRLTENLLDHGYMGDTIINGVQWDLHSYYPPGVPLDYPPLIAYLTAFIYKFVNIFADVPLLVVCFWLPAFVAPLAGIVTYLFVGRFTNKYGAVSAGILTVTVPFYFARTVPGWFDTDMFNLIFPLLMVWFLFEAYDNISTQKGILFSFLSAISLFLFSLAWNGWQYLFYIIIIFWVIQILWNSIKGRMVNNHLYSFLVFLVTTLALVAIFSGFANIIKLAYSPLQLINLSGGTWVDWPNVYSSVSELGKPSLEELVSDLGVIIFAGLFGILWICRIMLNDSLHKKFLDRMNWLSFSFLVLWIIAGFATLTQGVRFIMILIPPLVISTGIMVGIIVEYLDLLKDTKRTDIFKIIPFLIKIFAILVLLVSLLPGIINLENDNFLSPGTNDDVWAVSLWIKNNTANNTVIISTWSNGHVYTAIADRPVSEDGRMGYIETLPVRNYDDLYPFKNKSPSTARDYWICKSFSTDNESLSVGILRMLSTTGDRGYITLNMYMKNTTKTVEIMNNILGLDRNTSREILINKYNLETKQADEVLKYTHPENPSPMVLITNDGMLGPGYWTLSFGEWDFQKKQSIDFTYSTGTINIVSENLTSTNDVFMNLETGNITWKNEKPYCVGFVNNGTSKKRYIDDGSNFCIFIINNKQVVVLDRKFENSIFSKLVIEKSNSTVFKPIYTNKSVVVWGI